jgi:hypothetical protein
MIPMLPNPNGSRLPVVITRALVPAGVVLPAPGQRTYEAYAMAHTERAQRPPWEALIPAARRAWAELEAHGPAPQPCQWCTTGLRHVPP